MNTNNESLFQNSEDFSKSVDYSKLKSVNSIKKSRYMNEEMRLQKELDSAQKQIYRYQQEISILNSKLKYNEILSKAQKHDNLSKSKDIELDEAKIMKNTMEKQYKILEKSHESTLKEKNKLLKLAEEIAHENADLKKSKLKLLQEENDELKKNLSQTRADAKKQNKILMDLQEKMSYFENAFNEITAKFHDSHFLKIEKLYNLRYQGLENREPHLIEGFSEEEIKEQIVEKNKDSPRKEKKGVITEKIQGEEELSLESILKNRPKEKNKNWKNAMIENNSILSIKKELNIVFNPNFFDFKDINEEVMTQLLQSIKILKASNEFLFTQMKYDCYFLRGHIEFLEKDKIFVDSNFQNLEQIILEKTLLIENLKKSHSEQIETKEKIIKNFEEEKKKEFKNLLLQREDKLRELLMEIDDNNKNTGILNEKLSTSERKVAFLQAFIEKTHEGEQNAAFFCSKVLISHNPIDKTLKLLTISSLICDGLIANIEFSFENNPIDKNPSEKQGITSYFEVKPDDSIVFLQASFSENNLILMNFITEKGLEHKINNTGLLGKKEDKSIEIDLKLYPDLVFFPVYSNLKKGKFLFDVLCFNGRQGVLLFSLRSYYEGTRIFEDEKAAIILLRESLKKVKEDLSKEQANLSKEWDFLKKEIEASKNEKENLEKKEEAYKLEKEALEKDKETHLKAKEALLKIVDAYQKEKEGFEKEKESIAKEKVMILKEKEDALKEAARSKNSLSLSFSDRSLFKTDKILEKYRIWKVKIWNDSELIFGLKFFYEEIGQKKNQIEGLDHIPSHLLDKPFEEKIIEGTMIRLTYRKAYDNCVKNLMFVSEIIDGKSKKLVEYEFGSQKPILGSKEVEFKEKNIFLKTLFDKKEESEIHELRDISLE